jgi:HAAS
MPDVTGAHELDAYLDALGRVLELPVDEAAEVREEIAAHIVDLSAEMSASGLSSADATREAIRRLGPPDVLGRELTRARQTPRALLAAVGGATTAAAGAVARGYLLGFATVVVVLVTASLAIAALARLTGSEPPSYSDTGWLTVGVALASCVAAWLAARTFVSATARRSHRPARRIRGWVAVIGGALVLWAAVFWFQGGQNLVSVLALLLVPVVFLVAALTATDERIERSAAARRATLALFATVLVAVPVIMLGLFGAITTVGVSAVGSGPYSSMEELLHAQGFDMPGRFVADPPDVGQPQWSVDHGLATVEVADAAALTSRWRDLRVEAWRADASGGALDRSHTVPFATAPMILRSGSLVGSARVDRTRDVSQWWLFVTGTAADGGRDLVLTVGGMNSTFTGSAWDWLTAG